MGVDNRRASTTGSHSGTAKIQPGGQLSAQPKGRIYIAIDIESTGVEADTGEIIEVAALRFRLEKGGQIR